MATPVVTICILVLEIAHRSRFNAGSLAMSIEIKRCFF